MFENLPDHDIIVISYKLLATQQIGPLSISMGDEIFYE